MTDKYFLALTVIDANPEQLVRASETIGRTAAGLALDGINVSITAGMHDDDDEDDDE